MFRIRGIHQTYTFVPNPLRKKNMLLNHPKPLLCHVCSCPTVKRPQLITQSKSSVWDPSVFNMSWRIPLKHSFNTGFMLTYLFFRVSVSGWTFPWKGKGLLLQRLVLLPELPSGQLFSDPCTPVAQLGYQQAQGIRLLSWPTTPSALVKLVGGLSWVFTPIYCLRYLNRPRSSWNLFMRSPCWMSSSSTHVCMNIASPSAPSCVSVSSFSRCGRTCSAAERPSPKTSGEGKLVVTWESRLFLIIWSNKKGQ